MNVERYQALSASQREGDIAWVPQSSQEESLAYVSKSSPSSSPVAAILSSTNGREGRFAGAVQGLEIPRTDREGQQRSSRNIPSGAAGAVVLPLAISGGTGEQRLTSVTCLSKATPTWEEVTAHYLSCLHSS